MKAKKLLPIFAAMMLAACSEPDNEVMLNVSVVDNLPIEQYTVTSGQVVFEEINNGRVTIFDYPLPEAMQLPLGVYNISGQMVAESEGFTCNFITSAYQYSISDDAVISLDWVLYNPRNTLVFGEVYFTGSLNAKGTGGLYDSYFTIYNNTDEVLYADGLAIVESKMLNTNTDLILTPANQRDVNFTAQAVYVIPGSGTDVAINPGESIKIVDQAIDWTEQMPNALNHTDANFEWYDESTSASVVDTDNPSVPNLDKWFCYTKTIWIPSNQCNRSYALVRFPEGMNVDRFLAEQNGEYDYVNAATGKEMHANNCYLIKNEWIIDGINLCPTEKFTEPVLPQTIDRGYAAISEKNADVNRFGKKFVRRVSGTSPKGHTILQDTDNSGEDFEVVAAK